MSEEELGKRISAVSTVAVQLRLAVHGGDVEVLRALLRDDPSLVSARIVGRGDGTSTPLHLVTDWPGYFPHGREIVKLLIDAGADPNADDESRFGVRSGR